MPPKGKDVKGKQVFKIGTAVKDVVPVTQKNPPRESRGLKMPEQITKTQVLEYQGLADPEEWPGDEIVQQQLGDKTFTKANFETDGDVVFWRRPQEFLRKRYLIQADNEPPYMNQQEGCVGFREQMIQEDYYSSRIESIEKIQYMQNEIIGKLSICEGIQRLETEEEKEQRRKEFCEKQAISGKNKKGNKKQVDEVFDENPKMTSDVKLSDIVCNNNLPENARWIGSQLQMIKDRDIRDCNTGKPLSSKIFPQKDGAPYYNPQGKYVVKLYFMGKERKIQISDHMPVNWKGQSLLAQSSDETQLWPLLIGKALLQLWEHQSQHSLVGDGFVMYALSGFLSETLNLEQMRSWELFDLMMNNQHYQQRDVFLSAYSSINESNLNTANRSKKEYQSELIRNPLKQLENYETGIRKKHKSKHEDEDEEQQQQDQQQLDAQQMEQQQTEILTIMNLQDFKRRKSVGSLILPEIGETNLLTNYSYSLIEQFQNNTQDQKDQFNMVYAQKRSERELRLRQEYYDICKTSMNKMTKEEKLDLRRKKKELKDRLQDDDKKRIALISQPAIKHRFLRLKSSEQKSVIIYSPMAADEIYIAKKCIANNKSKPPNYDLPEIKGDDKSVVSATVKGDDSFSVKPLDDFTSIPNVQEPFLRDSGGFWIHEKEFLSLFQKIQLCYDPKRFKLEVTQLPSNQDYDLADYESKEILIVQRNQDEPENAQIYFLFAFQAKYASNIDFQSQVRPYAILQRFDLETYESIHDYKILNQALSSQMIILDNKNHIFRMNVYSPLNFTFWTASNNNVRALSVFEYLSEFEGYQKQTITVDYPACEANKYFLFFRFRVTVNSNKEQASFVYRIKSSNDNSMFKALKLKLIEIPPPGESVMLTTIEGVHKNLFEADYIIQGTQRFLVKANTVYYFLLEGAPLNGIAEGTLEMDFLYNNEFQINLLEQVEPTRYLDKYIPTKYAIIFRERVFSIDAQCTFYVRLCEGQAQLQQQQANKAKGGKGLPGQEQLEITEQEMRGERLFRLELFKGDDVITYCYGINKAVLSNVTLLKDENYILQATFDLREWPESKNKSEETDQLYWQLTVFSSDTVALIRDTTKEDREKAIKKQWEDKEPGRAINAKKARGKYMLTLKEDLTPEEKAILTAPRVTKKQREEEAKQAAVKKGPKKDDKKGKQSKVEQVIEQPKERIIPRSENHENEAIHQFLNHLEEDRIIDKLAVHAGMINIRNDVQKREIEEGILMGREELTGIFARNMKMREEIKLLQRDQKDIILLEHSNSRAQFKQEIAQILLERDQVRNDFSLALKREQQLFDLCKQEKAGNPEDIEKLIADPTGLDANLLLSARQVIQNWRILQIQEKINLALQNFDVPTLENCLAQITNLNIEGIDTNAAEDMIDEASGNPNFVQEKLAELKKQGKKPAKK